MLNLDTEVRLCGDVRWRLVGGEGVVLSQERGQILGVNAVGARVLHLLGRQRRVGDLVDDIGGAFPGTPKASVERDICEFLEALTGLGVLAEAVKVLPSNEPG